MTTPAKPFIGCGDGLAPDENCGLNVEHSRRRVLGSLIGASMAGVLGSAQAQTTPRTWVIAVVPQVRAEIIYRSWAPVLQALTRATGEAFSLSVASSIPVFETALLAGEPDFAYQNPYHQVLSRRTQGYIPLVRDSEPLTGIVVVRKDDPMTSTLGLEGKVVAFPAPNAFGASLWIRALLAERDKVTIKPNYVKTHSNAYRSVASGLSVAAGGVNKTFEEEAPEVRQALRVLMETPGAAPHPFSAHPRVPSAVREAVRKALLKMGSDPTMRQAMEDIPWSKVVVADYERDYAPLDRLGLEKYAVISNN